MPSFHYSRRRTEFKSILLIQYRKNARENAFVVTDDHIAQTSFPYSPLLRSCHYLPGHRSLFLLSLSLSLSLSFFEPHFRSFFSFLSPFFFLLICLSRLHLPEASPFASLSGGGSRAPPPLSSARR